MPEPELMESSGETALKATVITVTFNSSSTLVGYFAGIRDNQDAIAQLVIVDNGSNDDTLASVNDFCDAFDFPVTVVRERNVGFAAGYRAGEAVVHDRELPVLSLNPDVKLGPNTLESLLALLAGDEGIAIATGPLSLPDGSPDPSSVRSAPTFGKAVLYAVLGRFTPRKLRYNAASDSSIGKPVDAPFDVEATTGALMLFAPSWRAAGDGLFDTDYWMYGEDLQACADALSAGLRVTMDPRAAASVHSKAASSGRPRKLRSNIAFHNAMYVYFTKNNRTNAFTRLSARIAVSARLAISAISSAAIRASRATLQRGN